MIPRHAGARERRHHLLGCIFLAKFGWRGGLIPWPNRDGRTELELLAIVETLKEFNGMLWGQRITVYTDHKNLTRDGLDLTSDRVAHWRILLEEYAPKIIYIKGIHNTVADAISPLDYDPKLNTTNELLRFLEKMAASKPTFKLLTFFYFLFHLITFEGLNK